MGMFSWLAARREAREGLAYANSRYTYKIFHDEDGTLMVVGQLDSSGFGRWLDAYIDKDDEIHAIRESINASSQDHRFGKDDVDRARNLIQAVASRGQTSAR